MDFTSSGLPQSSHLPAASPHGLREFTLEGKVEPLLLCTDELGSGPWAWPSRVGVMGSGFASSFIVFLAWQARAEGMSEWW